MRDSKVGSMKHTHLIGCEDPRSQHHKEIVQDRQQDNSFEIREVPIHRLFNVGQCANASSALSAGKNVTDFDRPELVVFLQEDHQQFVKDICNDRRVSTKGTMVTGSSNSNGSECASQHPCIKDAKKKYGFRNLAMELEGEVELDSGDKYSTEHPTKERTSRTLGEVFNKEADFSRSFKNWQNNSFSGTIGSRMEFPHSAGCMARREMGNSQSLAGSGKRLDRQADYPGVTSSCGVGPRSGPTSHAVPATKSGSASHQSSDSISSVNSFAFPILSPEWKGSPVKMLEADRQTRKRQWRKICFPCYKF